MDKPKIHISTDLSSTEYGNLESHIRLHNTGVTHMLGVSCLSCSSNHLVEISHVWWIFKMSSWRKNDCLEVSDHFKFAIKCLRSKIKPLNEQSLTLKIYIALKHSSFLSSFYWMPGCPVVSTGKMLLPSAKCCFEVLPGGG